MGIKWEVDEDGNATGESITVSTGTFTSATRSTTPVESNELTNKGYIDGLVNGLDWQESVIDFYDPTISTPVTPTDEDRYISIATANGWTDKYIYQWQESTLEWLEIIPNKGFACWVESLNTQYSFNGTSWVTIGSAINHNILSGLQGGIGSEYYHFTNAEHTWLTTHTTNNGSQHSYINQDVKSIASPTFAGLTLTTFSGILKATAGVISSGATLDDVPDGVTYSRILATQVTSGKVIKLTDSGGKDLTVDCNGANKTLTIKSNLSLNQSLETTSSPSFTKVTVSAAPVDGTDLANKDYIDNVIANLNWQDQVKDRFDPTLALPIGPTTGDRYISTATANGWINNYIYQWGGLAWIQTIPTEGFALWVEDEDKGVVFNGTSWVIFNIGGSGSAGYTHIQGSASATWNVAHNLNSKYVNITCYDSTDSVLLPDSIVVTDGNNLVITFATSRTGRAVISAPSTAAVNTYLHVQSIVAGTWTISHNLQNTSPVVQIYDSSNVQVVPTSVTETDANTLTVVLPSPISGRAVVIASGASTLYTCGQLTESETGQGIYFNAGLRYKRTATAVDYSVQTTDYLVAVTDTSIARTITLPTAGLVSGKTFIIKDESGAASTNNITIATEGSEKIDNADTFVINSNFSSVTIYSDGTNYYII